MMFDAHAHWLPKEIIEKAHFFSPAWGDMERQLSLMDKFHIERALLLYPTSDAYQQMGGQQEVARIYNNSIAEVVKKYPERLIGAAILPTDEPKGVVAEFERATEELGVKVISLASSFEGTYLDDDRFHPLYEKAEALNTPLFVHPQTINPLGC